MNGICELGLIAIESKADDKNREEVIGKEQENMSESHLI